MRFMKEVKRGWRWSGKEGPDLSSQGQVGRVRGSNFVLRHWETGSFKGQGGNDDQMRFLGDNSAHNHVCAVIPRM